MTQDYDAPTGPGGGRDYGDRGAVRMHAADYRSTSGPGRTTIADAVVAKIAVLAAREIPGVHSMSTAGRGRAGGAQRQRAAGPSGGETAYGPGVTVAVGQGQATVDLEVVTFYGQSVV